MTSKEIALNYECPVCGAKPNMPCFGIPEDDPSRDPFDWRPAELMTPHKARETAYNRQNAAESLPAALVQETAVCPKCNRPHYNMEDSEFCRSMHDEEETPCPKREDGIHCNCWYDGNPCCACEDGKPETVAETKPTPFADETLTCPHGVGRCVCRICNGINWDPLKPQPDSSSIPEWCDLPSGSGYWWHHDGNPDLRPFIYHIQGSLTGSPRYFIDFPDSRWCDEVGGKWMKVVEPAGWNAAKGQR